jgi:hypothetical protein
LNFLKLLLESLDRVGHGYDVVGKGPAILGDRAGVRHSCAGRGIALVAGCQPAEEGFDVDDENERRKPVSLDDTPADRDGIGDAVCGSVDDHFGGDVRIDASDDSDGVRREPQVGHNFEKFIVVNGVEGI